MSGQAQLTLPNGVELLGELHPLLEQLGSVEGLVTLNTASSFLQRPKVENLDTLVLFLNAYLSQILLPFELASIHRAYAHASRQETRELIALDQEVVGQAIPQDFASASQRVGLSQLQRLRPLRDERIVQRYLHAAESGQAHAWHTLVYGITLALYSLPVRQGLLNYARQTLSGFIHVAARPLGLTVKECGDLLDQLCADLPHQVELIVAAHYTASDI